MLKQFLLVCTALFCLNALALPAAEGDWVIPNYREKELRLTLKSGDTIQGTFSAETKDKVMMTVVTPKGKNMQTVAKSEVTKHEWVAPAETEMKGKLDTWPADKFEDQMVYAQTMIDKGFKRTFFDYMRTRQKTLTADQFKLYGYLLLNNDMVLEAKDLIAWAQAEHNDWEEAIAAVVERLPKGPKVTSTGAPGQKPADLPDLQPGQIFCVGATPNTNEQAAFIDDARTFIKPEPKSIKLVTAEQLSPGDPNVLMLTFEVSWDLSQNRSGKLIKYSLAMIYAAKVPKVYQHKSTLVATWVGFPNPAP